MKLTKRDHICFSAGLLVGVFVLSPISALAQGTVPLGATTVGAAQIDSVSAGAVVNFLTNIVKRLWGGERAAPSLVGVLSCAVIGPIVVGGMLIRDNFNLATPAIIAGTIFAGWFIAGGVAHLIDGASREADKPQNNIPPAIAVVPQEQRGTLCCLHADCTHVMNGSGASVSQVTGTAPSSTPGLRG